jgi:sulfate adenylyltransferase subunit 1
MNPLRFITAGSVDDGKSTLIGRLLYDSGSICSDQLEALERQSSGRQRKGIDFSLLTDGLRAEREQGITIDLAYRYFSTVRRKFIIIDAPGHIQYTRNMVTGASNAQLIIILIDACNGVVEQTRRHAAVAGLLNIPKMIVIINKMDLVSYSAARYKDIVGAFSEVVSALQLQNVLYLPVSALLGENIVESSARMPWYEGLPLLPLLEGIEVDENVEPGRGRMFVQYVICPPFGSGEGRRYAGRISSGVFRKGCNVTVMPGGATSRILAIERGGREVADAYAQQSVSLEIEDHLDISRGDLMVTGEAPGIRQDLDMIVFWMDEKSLLPGNRYLLQAGSHAVRCLVRSIEYLLDIDTMGRQYAPGRAALNDIVCVGARTATPVALDAYRELPANGCAILIDETSYATVGACILL